MRRGEGKGFKRRSVRRIALLAVLLVGMMGTAAFGASAVKKVPQYSGVSDAGCVFPEAGENRAD